jgi:threonyl-tRNA synthetase
MQEIMGCLDFLTYIYECFDYTFEFVLSTRPETALGSVELWAGAEA